MDELKVWFGLMCLVWLAYGCYTYISLKRKSANLKIAVGHGRGLVLQDLDDMEQELTARLERGDLTAMEALGELTDIKMTRLKVLDVRSG